MKAYFRILILIILRLQVDYDNVESKFQLSFKTKVLQSFFLGHGDLWVGYTQISHWQIYNNDLSRPFRE
jgi:phospholipase A1